MKIITTLNSHIEKFLHNCVKSSSLNEFKKSLDTQRHKTGVVINFHGNQFDVYSISVNQGNFYLGFIETEDSIIIIGYHLNNDDIDENGNFIFITGSTPHQIGKINTLINNQVKL